MSILRKIPSSLLNKDDSYTLRGIAMLMIIFHHIWTSILQVDGDMFPYLSKYIFIPWGFMGTGLFFFLSGYGLFLSLRRNCPLDKSYIYKKLKMLLSPYVLCFALFVIALIICKYQLDLVKLLGDFLTLTLPTTKTWFYKVIIILYIVTFYIFKYTKNQSYSLTIILILIVAYVLIAKNCLPQYWYSSILNYPLGIFFAISNNKRRTIIQVIIGIILFLLLNDFCGISLTLPLSLLFSIISIIIIRYFNIKSYVLTFIGKESLSFYLFQLLTLFIGLQIGLSSYWIILGIFVYCGTYILAYLYSILAKK